MAEAWSGVDFLESVDGPLERFPVLRVLFLAHRVAATGTLSLTLPAGECRLLLSGGALVGGAGFDDLLLSHSVRGVAGEPIVELIGRAVAQGVPPERALEDAQTRLGERLAEQVGARGGRVVFRPEQLDPRARVSFPDGIPRIVAAGLRAVRPPSRLRGAFGARLGDSVVLTVPDDSPESRWGLDPAAMRVLRAVGRAETLGELLGSGPPGQSEATAYAVDLLIQLGLILVEPRAARPRAVPADAKAQPTLPPQTTTAATITATRTATAVAAPTRAVDAPLRLLKETHERLKDALPADLLGLSSADLASDAAIDKAHRELAARYHPDRNRAVGPEALALANDLFTRVNEAYAALKDPALRKDETGRVKAREEGRPFVSDQQRARARIAFARAEPLARNKRWAEALPELETAVSLDPGPWRYHFLKAQAAYYQGRMTAEEADRYLRGLAVPPGESAADVLYEAGEILMRAGKESLAMARFKEALAAFPDHHASKRRLRLSERRADAEPEKKPDLATASVSSVFSSLFKSRGRS